MECLDIYTGYDVYCKRMWLYRECVNIALHKFCILIVALTSQDLNKMCCMKEIRPHYKLPLCPKCIHIVNVRSMAFMPCYWWCIYVTQCCVILIYIGNVYACTALMVSAGYT